MKRLPLFASVFAACLIVCCLPRSVAAQGVGAIAGNVVDDSSAALPGVTVTLTSPGVAGGNQTVMSDERGAYQFTRLVPGRYGVRAELAGFRSTAIDTLLVNADATARADLKMGVGQIQEEMTVTAQAPLLDTSSALNQAVMTRDVIDSLPARNDLWSIGRMAPAVLTNKYDVGGSEAYQQTTSTAHGSSGDENAYMIDGLDVSWPGGSGGVLVAYFDPYMFQEINYQTSNAPAERPKGGVIYNMVSKTGANAFHGAYMYSGASRGMGFSNVSPGLRSQLLAAVPARVLAANPNLEPSADILSIYDTGATVSGPVFRNRLWFTAAAKYGVLNQYRLGSYNPDGNQVLDDNRMRNGSFKVSWQASQNNQLHYLYDWNNKGQFHRTGNLTTEFAESRATYFTDMYNTIEQARWTSVLSSRMVLDVAGSVLHGSYPTPPQPEVQRGDIARYDSVLRNYTVALGTYVDNPGVRANVLSSISYSTAGHDVKVGYQFNRARFATDAYSMSNYPTGLRAVYRNGVPDSVNTYNTPTNYVQTVKDQALFVQDRWTPMRKLTLNLGLRFETSYGAQPAACQIETIFIAGQCFDKVEGAPDWRNVVPRLSGIYDVFGSGRTAIKMSMNWYHIPVGVAYVNRINPIRTTSDTRPWTDRNGDLLPQLDELGASTGFNLGTTNRYADGIEWPYSNEFSLELEQQLPGEMVASVGYYRRGTRKNIGSKNLAVPASSYIPLSVTEVASGRPVTVFNQDPALRGRFDVVWDNYGDLDTQFNGVDLNLNKRLSNRWMLLAGLSLGRNYGDIYGTSDLNNPNFTFRQGVVGNDVPVSYKFSGLYELPYSMSISGSVQHFTGFPENTTVLVNANTATLTQVTQSLVVEPRGTTRSSSANQFDMSVRRAFKFGGVKAEPVLDFFNLFNVASIVSRTTQLGPTYGQAANVQRGRLIKFGVNLNF